MSAAMPPNAALPSLAPTLRALRQIDDPVFLGVVWRSVAWTLAAFIALAVLLSRGAHALLGLHGWLAGLLAGLAGGIGSALLAHVLFLPLAGLVGTLFVDRVAAAVERRFHGDLPPARPAPLAAQAWDGMALGLRLLLLQAAALLVAPFLAGASLPLGWAIAAWAIGRGLFVAVAMRRMPRARALAAYRALRPAVLFQGALMTAASLVPVANLLVPVLGVAAMVHVLHAAIPRAEHAGGGRAAGLSLSGSV